jgi:hypothetical protein
MRTTKPGDDTADIPYVLETLYDWAVRSGRRTSEDLEILHKAATNKGNTSAGVLVTGDRVDKLGRVHVGPNPVVEEGGYALHSPDDALRYRHGTWKKTRQPNALSDIRANFERDLVWDRKRALRYLNKARPNSKDMPRP